MVGHNLAHDPFNLIITGVGGQGNVLASKIVANILTEEGMSVTIGETFGASQRGGTVMSHLRVSRQGVWSPIIPKNRAHAIVALEPLEALRMLEPYGNQEVMVIANSRPVHPIGVICGDEDYPSTDQMKAWLDQFTRKHWLLPATDEAVKMGNPILANIMLIGALAGTGVLPIEGKKFSETIVRMVPGSKVSMNVEAFEIGRKMVAQGK